jgi:hypothetical protein
LCSVIIFLIILSSCKFQRSEDIKLQSSGVENTLRYVKNMLGIKYKSHQIEEDQLGNVYVRFESTVAVIKKADVFLGKLNDDELQDAVVSYVVVKGNILLSTNHLILLAKNDSFQLCKEIRKEMKVQKIENKILFTEQSKITYDSPNYGCQSCKFIVKYKLEGDTLIAVK